MLELNLSIKGKSTKVQLKPLIKIKAITGLCGLRLPWDDGGGGESKIDYYKVLAQSDIIISTSIHEFYGVSM